MKKVPDQTKQIRHYKVAFRISEGELDECQLRLPQERPHHNCDATNPSYGLELIVSQSDNISLSVPMRGPSKINVPAERVNSRQPADGLLQP